jgi:hypothetical protein
MSGTIPLLPQNVFMAWCLVKHRDNFTFNSKVYIQKNPRGEQEIFLYLYPSVGAELLQVQAGSYQWRKKTF